MIEGANELMVVLQAVWRRRWVAAAVAWAVTLVGIIVVSLIPNRYEATSRVYVDTQTVLKPLMAGLAFQPDIDQQVRMLARTVVSRPNIELLLKAPGVDLGPDVREDREHSVDHLIDKIKVDSSGGGNLYVISVRDTDAGRAKAIVTGLVNLFVDSGVDSKQRDSEDASTFIDVQIKAYEAKLAESENRLKDFKIRNFATTGLSNQDYYTRMSALADDVSKLRISLAAAEQGRDALRRELSAEDPQLPPDAKSMTSGAAAPSELDSRIETQRKQLDELLRRYTEEHPDVINAKRVVNQLEAQRRIESEAKAKSGSGKAEGSAATSPVYQRIRISLAEAEANVASLRSQLYAQQQTLEQTRATASKVPQAEAELTQLNRDYDIIRKNYDMLVSRREAASLGVKMDKSAQLADFRIIEPPRVAPRPVFPDRRILALAAMFLALIAGVVAAYGLSMLAPSFITVRSLQEFTKRPVLSSIGIYATPESNAVRRRDLMRFGGVVGAFFVLNVGWIAWVSLRLGSLS